MDDALKAAYGAGPRHSAYANNYGVVEILDKRLDTVRVSANSGSGYTEVYRYKLLTAMMGNREVLEKIQQYTTDLFSPPLTRAEFSYQPFLEASQPHGEEYTGDIISPHVSTYSDTLTEGIEDLTPMTTSYSGALADFNRDGLPDLLLTIHDLALAARIADRVVMLHRGRIVADGTPEAALTPPTLREVYGIDAQWFSVRERSAPLIAIHGRHAG